MRWEKVCKRALGACCRVCGRPSEKPPPDTDRHGQTLTDTDMRYWNPRTGVVSEGLQTVGRPRKKTPSGTSRVSMPAHGVASGSPASAQGASEAFILPVKMNAECPRAIRPRVKRSPYLIRRLLNAGRRNSKDRLQTRLHRCASKGVRGIPPKGARSAPGVRGGARLCRALKPCILLPHTDKTSPPVPRAVFCRLGCPRCLTMRHLRVIVSPSRNW